MNHIEFAEHTEHYTINGNVYTVVANFVAEIVMIKCTVINYFTKIPMATYDEFDGNMEEFVTSIVKP